MITSIKEINTSIISVNLYVCLCVGGVQNAYHFLLATFKCAKNVYICILPQGIIRICSFQFIKGLLPIDSVPSTVLCAEIEAKTEDLLSALRDPQSHRETTAGFTGSKPAPGPR